MSIYALRPLSGLLPEVGVRGQRGLCLSSEPARAPSAPFPRD